MRNIILLHPKHQPKKIYWSDRFKVLFDLICSNFNFEIQVYQASKPISKEANIIILYGWDGWTPPFDCFSNKSKVICYLHDMHHARIKGARQMKRMFAQCDKILVPYFNYFMNYWPQFADKAVSFPHFFASHNRYVDLSFNTNPIMKGLLSGQCSKNYPIRYEVLQKIQKEKSWEKFIDVLGHPRLGQTQFYTHSYSNKGNDYARYLNKYFCCITDSSRFELALTKCFEIPAAGSLLLTNEIKDLKALGFIPGKHYVPITCETVFNQIIDCLENPDKYQEIRKEGMKFVRENHSVQNRILQLKSILEGMK